MELQVSTLSGFRDCFVALPLHVIEALQGRQKLELFSVVLELRLPHTTHGKNCWYLSWAGAVSTSSRIEVSKKLAECLGLPDGATLHLRALTDVANAASVEVEPVTEDDWEILQLNAGFVEGHILNQVGVLCSGQLFPIWVQGDISLMLHVISTTPKQMVRLVPGTEFIVAPKPRKTFATDAKSQQVTIEPSIVKAALRVQSLDSSLLQPSVVSNLSCFIAPTTSIFVSENSAKKIPLCNGQLVIVTPLDGAIKSKDQNGRSKGENKDMGNIDSSKKEVIVRVVYYHLAANGHAMIASSIQQFLGAEIHTRIQVKSYIVGPCMINPTILAFPIYFKAVKDTRNANHIQDLEADIAADRASEVSVFNWEKHKQLLEILSVQHEKPEYEKKGSTINDGENTAGGKLFKLWAAAQFSSIHECESENRKSLLISNETVMEFLVPMSPRNRNTTKQFPFEEYMDCSSEIIYFFISLQNSDDHDEKRGGSEIKQTRLFLLEESLLGTEGDFHIPLEVPRVRLGQSQIVPSLIETKREVQEGPRLASMAWLKEQAFHALERLQILLSSKALERCHRSCLPLPGYVLLHGPQASGKTKLALAIAKELEENPSILAHKIMVKCSELVGEPVQTIRASLQGAIVQALKHAPSLIILDDLDMAVSSNSNPESRELSASSAVLTEFLSDILDTLQDHTRNEYGCCIAFLALVQSVSSLPISLCSSGRFDLHLGLPTPATEERASILLQELVNRRLVCKQDIISETASKCDGYDAFDLEVLVDRAVHAASARLLPLSMWNVDMSKGKPEENAGMNSLQNWKGRSFEILKEDFEEAFSGFLPVAMRDIAKPTGQVGRLSWEDVGGLNDTCQTLQEMLELPVKYSKIFSNAPLRLRSGVLLYGPPGCGKTHVVGVAAAACSLRLISVKGPELLNKYIGASEQGVRDIFAKATAAAPCILFFDEFDAIAPKRGHDNTGVTDRVVNQLLTELDGVEALNGVFVFAATSRPDLLDAALLRPGRLDRLLICDFPSRRERLEILQVLSRKLPLSEDVNLDAIASLTENFSGADLQAVLSDAQLEAVHSFLSETKVDASSRKSENPKITMTILTAVLLKARPSVSTTERRRLYNIYEMFMNSRSSLTQKARDVKGKRATLA